MYEVLIYSMKGFTIALHLFLNDILVVFQKFFSWGAYTETLLKDKNPPNGSDSLYRIFNLTANS